MSAYEAVDFTGSIVDASERSLKFNEAATIRSQ